MKKYGILFLTLLLGFASGGCGNHLSGPEKTAVRFYKEVWVEGDLNHSSRLLAHPRNRKELGWRVEQTRSSKQKNPPILITVSPSDSQMMSKTIWIHRPSDKRDFRVKLRRTARGWKVVNFQQNYDNRRGGYIGNDAFQRYVREYPGMKWKRVESP
ncbi:hypothetical protein JOD24_000894 [Kroppenstedtia sanguinis]|uniref:Lipoprotein n=1 Tax=Kroppenstedtia sanguinis TaxID=1380684 RepID=A0ABW4C9C1_9BACL